MNLNKGKSYPLGATWDGEGTNFALFSVNATGVELCLFDENEQESRLPLVEVENHVWYGYFLGIKPGQRYGFRVYGPYEPEKGHFFNPAKLLIDPYAKVIAGDVIYGQELFNYALEDAQKVPTLSHLGADNAHLIPKCIVIDDSFDWEGDQRLNSPWHKTIIYETHVKGFTQLCADIPENLRGTYAGLAHPVTIKYLKSLGITAIELLPIHHIFPCPQFLAEKGLKDYWGYRTLGYFAPYSDYSSSGILGEQVREFKAMVKAFHKAGIEVILDVVYNHSAEGTPSEPTLFLRGIDNTVYYRLNEEKKSEYIDFTGCGNSLNVSHPQVLKLIIDSLRYWVTEMHIDGFRFDEAPTLARECFTSDYQINFNINQENQQNESNTFYQKTTKIKYDTGAAFFDIIYQDPILSQVKLISEAWDAGNEGYHVGNFPLLWSEWNGQYRDIIRDFWRSEQKNRQAFINCFLGSPNLYKNQGKQPHASINYITCHDGFTLNDLVSYNEKHNEANGENSRDGSNSNHAWNCGVEGPTDNLEILALREKQKRNFLTTLLLSQGVPMLLGGDEFGRTQRGNNNAYCQDNAEFSWFNWDLVQQNETFFNFTQKLIKLRCQYPIFSQRNWLKHKNDIAWFNADGSEISQQELESGNILSVVLKNRDINQSNSQDSVTFILLFNSHYEEVEFTLPSEFKNESWQVIIDTNESNFIEEKWWYKEDEIIKVQERSLLLLLQQSTT